jgi:hypothetical protein
MDLTDHDLQTLLDFADQSPWRLPNGSRVAVQVRTMDKTDRRPHGLKYRLVVQDTDGERLFGFDNSHEYDGSPDGAPFDHEHEFGRIHKRIAYAFTSASGLVADFFDRCKAYCDKEGTDFVLEPWSSEG